MGTFFLVAVVVVVQEGVLVTAIYGKGNSCNPETWEAGFKSVPSGERACVSPCLANAVLASIERPKIKPGPPER